MKNLRLKANAENADIVKAVGGAPVTMPITETYDALQKGLLEGVFSTYEVLKYWKFADVVKCFTIREQRRCLYYLHVHSHE